MANARGKRQRRQMKQALKFGWKAKPRHALQAGRTGSVRHKQRQAMKNERDAAGETDKP